MTLFRWKPLRLAIMACWLLLPNTASAEGLDFTAGPYLLDVTGRSATIAFHLQEARPAEVTLFDGDRVRRFAATEPAASHFITVDGLTPSRTYRYSVHAGDARTPPEDPAYQIKTAGPPGDAFHFVVYGDPRPGESGTQRHHRAVVAEAASLEPFFSVILGDMVDAGDDAHLWQNFFDVEAPLIGKAAVYPVMGDNDRGELAARFFPKLKQGYYRFTWGGVEFFVLNAWDSRGRQARSELDENSPQIRWLTEQLALPEVQAAPFRVIFSHDPVLISRGSAADIMRRAWPPLFEKHKVDLVFASWHLYERSQQNGVVYVVSGGAGAELIWMEADPAYPSLVEAREHHFCRVDVDGEALTIRAVATDGTILDEFTLTPRAAAGEARDNARNLAARVRKPLLFGDPAAAQALKLHLFSYDCAFCRRLTQRVLPDLSQQYGLRLAVDYYDLGLPESYGLFLSAEAAYGRQGADLPAIFLGRRILGGENEIRQELSAEIERFLVDPQGYHAEAIQPFTDTASVDIDHSKENAFRALSLPLVAGAGLLDGLNPCAFTTIILLVSYLHLFGADARRVYWTGTMFTLGVFATYFIIGLTFYHYLQNVLLNPAIATAVNLVLLAAVLLLAALSAGDGFRALKEGATGSILKLPRVLRDALEARIRHHTRSGMGHLAAPLLLGALVSGIELTCTGQVYIPIVTMIADPRYRIRAVTYLGVYNLAFILPLLAVFLLSAWGRLHAGLGRSRPFVATVKFGNAALFSIMAVIILYNIGII